VIRVYLALGLLAALVAGGWWAHHVGYMTGRDKGRAQVALLKADYAKRARVAESHARQREHAAQLRMAAIEAKYREELSDAKTKHETLVADLRAGTVRLRHRWQGCRATAKLSGAAARAASADDEADDRRASAARIVAAAEQADAKIRGLQAVVKADRALPARAMP
jgi:nitrate reductase alpha subunit